MSAASEKAQARNASRTLTSPLVTPGTCALRIVGIGSIEIAVRDQRPHAALRVGQVARPDAKGLADSALASLLEHELLAQRLAACLDWRFGCDRGGDQIAVDVEPALGQRGHLDAALLSRLGRVAAVRKDLDEALEVVRILAVADEGPQHLIDGQAAARFRGLLGFRNLRAGITLAEDELRLDRAGDPGDLRAAGRLANVAAHRAERVVDIEIGYDQGVGERRRIGTVDAGAVIGDLAGTGGEGDEHLAAAGLGVGKALLQPLLLRRRVVAASIEDEELSCRPDRP